MYLVEDSDQKKFFTRKVSANAFYAELQVQVLSVWGFRIV